MSIKLNQGMHYYINISNYNDVIENEEKTTGELKKSIHALDVFFTSIEIFAKRKSQNLTIEKITGSRLHIFISENIDKSLKIVWEISCYARSLSTFFNEKINIYKNLIKFELQFGASFGKFYEFVFCEGSNEELTTIGYVANFAAKLQNKAKKNYLAISEEVYLKIINEDIKIQFEMIEDSSLNKYNQNKYYQIHIRSSKKRFENEEFTSVEDRINKNKVSDINFYIENGQIDFRNVSVLNVRKIYGSIIFADVRGFTEKFEKNDINIEDMVDETIRTLKTMHDAVKRFNGVHVQFQGDREMALFQFGKDENCFENVVLAAMLMLDKFKNEISIGIGVSYGKLFVTKLGARGNKDNIVLGRAINEADSFEGDEAKKGEIVISYQIYTGLMNKNAKLANLFMKRKDYYVSTTGYDSFSYLLRKENSEKAKKNKTYIGAWLDED